VARTRQVDGANSMLRALSAPRLFNLMPRGLSEAQKHSHPNATEGTPKSQSCGLPDFKINWTLDAPR
jgi:hypothetical protein